MHRDNWAAKEVWTFICYIIQDDFIIRLGQIVWIPLPLAWKCNKPENLYEKTQNVLEENVIRPKNWQEMINNWIPRSHSWKHTLHKFYMPDTAKKCPRCKTFKKGFNLKQLLLLYKTMTKLSLAINLCAIQGYRSQHLEVPRPYWTGIYTRNDCSCAAALESKTRLFLCSTRVFMWPKDTLLCFSNP